MTRFTFSVRGERLGQRRQQRSAHETLRLAFATFTCTASSVHLPPHDVVQQRRRRCSGCPRHEEWDGVLSPSSRRDDDGVRAGQADSPDDIQLLIAPLNGASPRDAKQLFRRRFCPTQVKRVMREMGVVVVDGGEVGNLVFIVVDVARVSGGWGFAGRQKSTQKLARRCLACQNPAGGGVSFRELFLQKGDAGAVAWGGGFEMQRHQKDRGLQVCGSAGLGSGGVDATQTRRRGKVPAASEGAREDRGGSWEGSVARHTRPFLVFLVSIHKWRCGNDNVGFLATGP